MCHSGSVILCNLAGLMIVAFVLPLAVLKSHRLLVDFDTNADYLVWDKNQL